MRLRRRRALNPLFARGMAFLFSAVRKETLDLSLVRIRNHVVVAQTTEALAVLVDQPVVATGLRALHASRSGDLEPLGRGLVRLHLRHEARLPFRSRRAAGVGDCDCREALAVSCTCAMRGSRVMPGRHGIVKTGLSGTRYT